MSTYIDTGYVRDVADLEELFTNVIPYLYSMQLLANGYDGEDAFEGEMIQDLAYYKDINPKAWLFRSNWVTKIMENKEFHAKGTVSDSEGNKYEVANMLIPSCYPENRPMIFSESQMRKENLQEYDLNLVELKCVKINNDIMKEWTLLINYASVKGMTKEVMLRQMAFDALVLFNSVSLGPFSFQPSEFAKVAVILFLAHIVTKNAKDIGKMRTMIKIMVSILPIVGLVGASNLSTAIIILGIGVILIFVASPKYGQFVFMGLLGIGFMAIFLALESYRLERLAIWRNPEAYEKGYQTLQGLYAIGSRSEERRVGKECAA